MAGKTRYYPPLLNWSDFESLCLELFAAAYSPSRAQKYGTEGTCQHGVDISLFFDLPASHYGVQCKLRNASQKLTVAHLREEITKAERFDPPLSRYIVATTARRDPLLQDAANKLSNAHAKQGLFTIEVLFWEDINDLLNKHDAVALEFYGPGQGVADIISEMRCALQNLATATDDIKKQIAELTTLERLVRAGDTKTAVGHFRALSSSVNHEWSPALKRAFAAAICQISMALVVVATWEHYKKYGVAREKMEKDREVLKQAEDNLEALETALRNKKKYFPSLELLGIEETSSTTSFSRNDS